MQWSVAALGLVIVFGTCSVARAQDQRVFVNLNFGAGSQTQRVGQAANFSLYDETWTWETQHEIKTGSLVDVGGGFRVMRNVSVGATYTMYSKDTRDAVVTTHVPSPIFFNGFRSATGTRSGLKHRENALHLQGLLHVPVPVDLDVTLFAGPTFFTVEDEFVESISVSEVGGDFTALNLDQIATTRQRNTSVGLNMGVDARYMFIRSIGVGAMLRYSRGRVELTPPANTSQGGVKIDVGGFEFGAGLRFKF